MKFFIILKGYLLVKRFDIFVLNYYMCINYYSLVCLFIDKKYMYVYIHLQVTVSPLKENSRLKYLSSQGKLPIDWEH